MPLIINKELIESPDKTLIKENLFDFLKKRENMNLCGSENLYQTIFKGGLFLNFYHG
jgi:hypothetical protein|tara:strand:- start:630 stop:800 length:171 start_codon:yes stop_codon:yes gene_type:complete